MVLLLVGDVFGYLPNTGMGHREDALSTPPSELSRDQVTLVDPVRRATLEKLHHFLKAQMGRQIHQSMYVLGVHVINFYVNAFLGRVTGEVGGNFTRCSLGKDGPALQRGPNKVKPDPRIRMHRHAQEVRCGVG